MTTIFEETFETNGLGTRYTLSDSEFHTATSTINDDFFGRTNGTLLAGVAFSSSVSYAFPQGSFYFAANDTDESLISTHSRTITFAPIDISGFTNLSFSGLFAEDDFTFVIGTEDWDADTRVYVEVAIDGGAFAKVIQFAGTGTNTAPQLDTNLDGIGDGTALTDTFQTFTAAIAGTGTTLDMRVVMENLNNNDEDIAFDNLQITGDAQPPATLSTVFVGGIDESIEDDVQAQIVLSFDTPPGNLTTIRITPSSSDVDLGVGAGNARVVVLGSNPVTITATAVNDALVEGDETALLSFELAGTLDPAFSLNPVPDLSLRLVDSDANNAPEGAYLLHQEGFETDGNGSRYSLTIPEFTDLGTDFFFRTNGSSTSSEYEVFGQQGSFYFAVQDIDNAIAVGTQPSVQSLIVTGIDISDHENLVFSALFAEDDQDIFQSIDSSDGLRIRARIDGGSFVDILGFEAGGGQSNEVPQLDTDLDGVGDGAALTDTFQQFTAAIAGTGSVLDLLVEFQASFSNEDFAIDDIRVTGDALPDLDLFVAGFVDVVEGGQGDTIRADVRGTPDAGDIVRLVASWDPTEYSVNGNTTGALTIAYTGTDVLNGNSLGEVFSLTAVDDNDDEISPQQSGQNITFDVISADSVEMDAISPQAVNVRVWDNDGDTGADGDGAFLLHQEGFETNGNGSRYTLSSAEFNVQNSIFGGDWFTRSDGSDLENAAAGAETWGVTASEGNFFFTVQDINNPSGDGLGSKTMTITGIDIDGFENLHFDIDLAEDDQDDGLQDWNGATEFRVEAQIDGGGFVEILSFRNTGQTDAEPGHDTDFDNVRDGVALQEAFQEFGADILGTGQDLDLRFTFNDFLFSGEDIAIDDIRVTGDVGPFFVGAAGEVAGGNPIPDSSFGLPDGVADFNGQTASPNFDLTVTGADTPDGLVLGQTVRVIQQGSDGIHIDAEGTVASTNVDGGVVLLEGSEISSAFGVTQLVVLDTNIGLSTPVTLEVGPSTPPNLVLTDPLDDAVSVPVGANIDLTFDETVVAGTGLIEIRFSDDDSLVESFDVTGPNVSFRGSLVRINPTSPLPLSPSLYVTVAPGAIRDLAGSPFEGIVDPSFLNFATNVAPVAEDSVILTTLGATVEHLLNGFDANGDPLTFALETPAVSGSVSVDPDGRFTYQAPTFPTFDLFTYTVDDGLSAPASSNVTIAVSTGTAGFSGSAGNGNDVVTGTALDDDFDGAGGSDLLIGGAGADSFSGGDGDDTLEGGTGGDTLDGGAGSDTVRYQGSADPITLLLDSFATGGDATGDVITNVENVTGTAFDDVIFGNAQDNEFIGLDGRDYLSGGAGNDTLFGGAGADLLESGAGDDIVDGGDDQDLLSAFDATSGVIINLTDMALSSADYAGDTLISIEGILGSNTVSNTLVGSSSEDLFIGGDQTDRLIGGGSADILLGQGGGDSLFGGSGSDVLLSGFGDDTITGGGAADTFLFALNEANGEGDDLITDFALNSDLIIFYGTGFVGGATVTVGTAAGSSNAVLSYGASSEVELDGITEAEVNDPANFVFVAV